MNRTTFKVTLFISRLLLSLFVITSCGDDTSGGALVQKNNLLYREGSNVPFTGKEKAKLNNKVIEYDVVNGIKHGEFKLYFENGYLEMKGQLDSNKNTGKWQYFYPSGGIESEGYFVDDKPEGRWVWYFEGGKVKEEGSFNKGKRVGWWKQYDEKGRTILQTNMELNDSLAVQDSLFGEIKKSKF